jgi:predicted Zn-dependent protease
MFLYLRHCITPALLAFLLLTSACTTNKATGEQSFTAFMSEEDEKRVGAEEHPKILEQFGGEYGDARLKSYVRAIGKKLAAVSEVPDLPYRFTILNDEKVNAFALPGGYVYLTRGLLALAENEAEMAGVLAHEIGHITARHSAQRYSTAQATNIGLTVLGVLGSVAGLPSGIGQVASLGANAAIQGYSRGQELQADMLGVRYMTRIGYSPDGMTGFFRKLNAHSGLEAAMKGEQGVSHNIMSTHPRTEDRIVQAIKLAKAKRVNNPRIARNEFLDQIDGIVFGSDPSQGIVRDREFVHPELKIRFQVPADYVIFNSPSHVKAIGPHKSTIIFDMANQKKAKQVRNLNQYLTNDYGKSMTLSGVERIDVNGLTAVTGASRLQTQIGPRDVRLLVIRGNPEQIFQFAFFTPPEKTQQMSEDLRRTTYSFQRISDKEAANLKPLKIKLIRASEGQTISSLARGFPYGRFNEQWLTLLNGLSPKTAIQAGQRIKLVVE